MQSIKSFSRGDAFKCYTPQIRNTQEAIHIVNQGNLSITSPFQLKFMPTKKKLFDWKDKLVSENKSGRKCVVHSPFGVFSEESINDLIRLHRARVIKAEVAEEMDWLNSSMEKPSMVADHPLPESISMFKSLIHSQRFDEEIAEYGMSPQELSKVCCNRWLSCDHILWIVKKLNSMQSSTMCVYLNFVRDIKRFVAKRLRPDQPRPSSLIFILNVGKSHDGSVYLSDDENQGNHWSICYLDKGKRTVTYADSLAYNVPTSLKEKITEIYKEIYDEEMSGFSFKKCHDHTGRKDGKCGPKCAKSYPLQTCGSVCGLVAITSTALACLAKSVFQNLISKDAKFTGFFFTTPSKYAKYLRMVLCTWIVKKTVTIQYVLPKEDVKKDDHEQKLKKVEYVLPNENVKKDNHEQKLKKVEYVLPNEDVEKDDHEQKLKKVEYVLPNENTKKDDHEQKLKKVGYVLPNTNLKKDCHEQMFKKVNKITSTTFQNKARVPADNKTHHSFKGCENDPNVANTTAQKIADSTKNNSGNLAKDFDKVHKCPHCQQTCKKLYNLRRHISRLHGDISTENKKNETGRCTCLDCGFKCHKITDLRIHLQKAHGTIMNTTTANFNTKAGM